MVYHKSQALMGTVVVDGRCGVSTEKAKETGQHELVGLTFCGSSDFLQEEAFKAETRGEIQLETDLR